MACALCGAGAGRAQASDFDAPTFEFSNSAASHQGFAVPRLGRHVTLAKNEIAALPTVMPSARSVATTTPAPTTPASTTQESLFGHFFANGIADLVQGDAAGAAATFELTDTIASGLPQMDYLFGLAQTLADFDHRERALAKIRAARAADPAHPLYAIIEVLADPRLSQLRPDGALYFAPAGIEQLHAALARLPAQHDAYNGKYLAELMAGIETTGDAQRPARFKSFAALLAPGRPIVLPDVGPAQALGRLFALTIPAEQLARYETRFLTGNVDSRENLAQTPSDARDAAPSHFSVLLP